MGVDIVVGVAVPCHEASYLASKKDSLHVLVLERESIKKGFPYLLIAQKLVRAVVVKNGIVVGELGPQKYKTVIYSAFVHSHDLSLELLMTRSSAVTIALPRGPRVRTQLYWIPRASKRP
jgi:hypothetical protein